MDIRLFTDSYVEALTNRRTEEVERLEEEGKNHHATYTDVAHVITTLMAGMGKQLSVIEEDHAVTISILVDAFYEAGIINDEVISSIEHKLKQLNEENEDDKTEENNEN